MEPRVISHPVRLAGASLLRLQSDARLVDLTRAGHEGAFAAIVHRYRPALLRYCTRVLGTQRAEDAVQQMLASAHSAMTTDDEAPRELRAWLYRIAHNTALNMLRTRRDEAALTDDLPAAGHAPDEAAAGRERLDAVLAAIAALPPRQRDAILLRELEGRSHEEIAETLGLSPGAARQQLFRARAAVRAACTAITPTPLLARLFEVGEPSAQGVTKAVAAVLATGAVAGGVVTTGVVHRNTRDGDRAQAPNVERSPAKPDGRTAASAPPAPVPSAQGTGADAGAGPRTGRPAREARVLAAARPGGSGEVRELVDSSPAPAPHRDRPVSVAQPQPSDDERDDERQNERDEDDVEQATDPDEREDGGQPDDERDEPEDVENDRDDPVAAAGAEPEAEDPPQEGDADDRAEADEDEQPE